MVQIISNGIKTLLEQANSVVQTMSIEAAAERFDKTDYVFVDLRDIREIHRSGKIPGAFSCPRGMLEFWIDPESPYHKDVFNQDKTFVFYCASAWRSALSAQTAQNMGLAPVVHLDGGFTAWSKANLPIEEHAQKS